MADSICAFADYHLLNWINGYFTMPFSRYSVRLMRMVATTFCISWVTMMRTSSSNEVVWSPSKFLGTEVAENVKDGW